MPTIRERNGAYQIDVYLGRDIYGKKIRESITYTPDPALTPKKREKAVEDFAREKGCYNVTLNVWTCNPRAAAFYE